ncbi:serine hydrolase domain-containing protein [Pseudomonas sp. RIT-PI-AD]|uniref:serine hydrolase domain-containing protein n=1 Tax=Pseudomonas sp. RIT-PI-AD TaxID=3035294 RepID=UPI0021D8DC9A|nr:serine hydrolase domain-containing protein [Pseudomonas sp. RIT-PI-AD]
MPNPLDSSTAALPDPDLEARLDRVVQASLAERRLVGCVVLVARDGVPVYRRAAGLADREAGRPMREDTLFRLASVTKVFVSTAALVLVAQGRLALDEPLDRKLPEFRPCLADGRPARISLRQALSHSAGLGYRFLEEDADGPYARAGVSDGMDRSGIDLAENLRRIAQVPLLYPPGSQWGYSLATDVVGALVARVCGGSLGDALREWVGVPLGLLDSGFEPPTAERLATVYVSDTPAPHRLAEGETVAPLDGCVGIRFEPARAFDADAFHSGGAGMVGSAGDVLALLESLRRGGAPLLPPALVEEMGRDQIGGPDLPTAPGFGFGLGFSVLRDPRAANSPESPGTWRWGGAYGHSWFVDRARALSVVALTNTLYEGMNGRFVEDLRDAVYGRGGHGR